MVRTYVSLKHADVNGGSEVQIYCTKVVVSFNKKNDKTPNNNYNLYPASVQTLSRENVHYTLQGVKLDKGDLDYATLLDLVSLANDGGLTLKVIYNSKSLTDSTGSVTEIPVTFDGSFNVVFDTVDSLDSSVPSLTIPLVEVKV